MDAQIMKKSTSQSTALLEDHASSVAPSPRTLADEGQALHAEFYRLRVLSGALVVIGFIASVMLVLHGDGVTIDSFYASEKSDEEQKKLTDYYNSITGSVGSLVFKPIDMFLGVLIAVACLCFATDVTLATDAKSAKWKLLPVVTAAALAYLFSNGLNALNVQVSPGKPVTRINEQDLSFGKTFQDDQQHLPNGSLSTPWNRAFLESSSGNSVLNTILRTKLVPIETGTTQCTATGYENILSPIRTVPLVSFGFQTQAWQIETFPNALTPTGSLKIPMSIKSVSELPKDAKLPMPANIASNLVSFGLQAVPGLFLFINQTSTIKRPETPNGAVRIADVYNLTTSLSSARSASFLSTSHALWKDLLARSVNVTATASTVEYNRFSLSDKITFDSVTLELPVAKVQFDTEGNVLVKEKSFNQMLLQDFCSRDGCITPTTVFDGYRRDPTVQPRVSATSICLNADGTEDLTTRYYKIGDTGHGMSVSCERTSNNSIFVVGVGMRLEADVWDKEESANASVRMKFKGLRTVYSVTIGRLAWETENLAQAFGAECGIATGCDGLRYKMQSNSSKSDYLVVGKSSLPLTGLSPLDPHEPAQTKWKNIVSVATPMEKESFDLILPRRAPSITANGFAARTYPAEFCSMFVDDYINTVEKNHLYMEQSLQTSYTAAFYFLFQSGVRQKSLNTTTSASISSPELAFAGNLQRMNVQVSIPTTNVIISLVGCGLVFLVSIGVVFRATRSAKALQERANAEIVTEAIINGGKFPPWLLKMTLQEQSGGHEGLPVPVQDLCVQNVSLSHSEDDSRVFHVGSEVDV